jgi:hypothetical protein
MAGQLPSNTLSWSVFPSRRGRLVMLSFHLGLSDAQRTELEGELVKAKQAGDLRRVIRVFLILALADGMTVREIARMLKVSHEAYMGSEMTSVRYLWMAPQSSTYSVDSADYRR